jgi:hypothetical protein
VQDGRLGCGHESCARVQGQGPDGLIPPHKVRGQYVGDSPNFHPILFRHATGRGLSGYGPHFWQTRSALTRDCLTASAHSSRRIRLLDMGLKEGIDGAQAVADASARQTHACRRPTRAKFTTQRVFRIADDLRGLILAYHAIEIGQVFGGASHDSRQGDPAEPWSVDFLCTHVRFDMPMFS